MTRFQAPRGAPDVLPPDSELLEEVEGRVRALFCRYGYRRIDLPVFEHSEVFVKAAGEGSELVVGKQMYVFSDAGGRSLTLRPEGTPGVLRAFVEHRLDQAMPLPVRLAYMGPMFRYERPQKGRFRQFDQWGAECIGSAEPVADAEVVALAADLFAEIGLEPQLLLNSMGCPEDRARYAPAVRQALEPFASELCADCRRRLQTNPMRVFDCKVAACRRIVRREAPRVSAFRCEACDEHLRRTQELLDAQGVAWKPDDELVRGLDYYTRTVFEFHVPTLGAQTAVGGGGRYDGLVEAFGGPPLPGVGMAVGVQRTLLALRQVREPAGWRPDAYLAWLAPELAGRAMALARELRRAGLRVVVADEAKSLRAQLRAAGRLGARHAVILGPTELAGGAAALKDLRTGSQETVPLDQLAGRLG